MVSAAPVPVLVTSFGYPHSAPPAAHLVLDLRGRYPRVGPGLYGLTAYDTPVREGVLAEAGVAGLVAAAAGMVRALRAAPGGDGVAVAVGCATGRHHAPVVALALARALAPAGPRTGGVQVLHRDLYRTAPGHAD